MSQKESCLTNRRRRSFAFLLAWGLGIGFVLFVIAYATKPVPARAEKARASLAQSNTPAPLALQAADLVIDKEGPDSTWVNQAVTYTLKITNNKGATINNVVITDSWAASEGGEAVDPEMQAKFNGVYWTTPSGFNPTLVYEDGTQEARWDLGSLPAGFSGAIEFTMSIPADLQPLYKSFNAIGPSTLGNSAEITGTDVTVSEPDQVVTAIQGPVFKLEKFAATEPGVGPRPGHLITYTLRLDNLERQDAIPATGIIIGETLPDGLLYIDAWAGAPGSTVDYGPSTGQITWTLPSSLAVGEAVTATFVAQLPEDQEWNKTITNDKASCWAISNELAKPVECWGYVRVRTLGIFDKTYVTEPSDLGADDAYQSSFITYTVFIFNPLRQTLVHNLRITDVMPSSWDFVSMVEGDDPVWPSGEISNTMAWYWPGEALQPGEMISFTFVAFIGPDTPISGYGCETAYYNDLAASADEFPLVYQYGETFNKYENGLAKVTVQEQIELNKEVDSGREESSEQVAGEAVTYTVTLENVGGQLVSDIIFTDTLPDYFRFGGMVEGPEPIGVTPLMTTVVWSIGDLDPDGTYQLAFTATVDGPIWGASYKNNVDGYSSESSFCPRDLAAVTVLSPIQFTKVADPPLESEDWVVQGEWFEYIFECWNNSGLFPYTLVRFGDVLQDGFEAYGYNFYSVTVPEAGLPFTLTVDMQDTWVHTFQVDTPGEGAGTDWCNDLRIDEDASNPNKNRELFQAPMYVGVTLAEFEYEWIANAQKMGYLLFKPHVDLRQIVHPKKVDLGGTVEVTLTLHNNMRDHQGGITQTVDGITVTYEIPSSFEVVEVITPTPPPTTQTNETLIWTGVNLPAGEHAETHLRLRLAPPSEAKTTPYIGRATASAADPSICIPRSEARYYVVKGVEIKKTPDSSSVGPFGKVEYTIELNNKTTAPVTGLTITDTLPEGFQFLSVLPGYPEPVSTNPLVWRDLSMEASPASGATERLQISFEARAPGVFGGFINELDFVSDSTYVTYTGTYDDYKEDVRVQVIPGVALYKSVWPSNQAAAGETVVYTLTVDNRSNKAIAGVRVTDTLPQGLSYQETLAGAEPIMTTPDLVWTVSQLDDGETAEFVFRAAIDDQIPNGTYCNQASATAHEEGDPEAQVTIPDTDLTACLKVLGVATVQRYKTVSPLTVQMGDLVTYTITLYNEMDEQQTLRLTDTLPVSFTYIGVGVGTPAPALTSPVVWQGLAIDSQQAITLVLMAQVHPFAPSGTYYNRLDAETGDFVLPPMAQLAPVLVQGVSYYDLQIAKSDGVLRASEGQVLNYTITYTNVNDADLTLTGLVITDTFGPLPYATPVGWSGDWNLVAANVYTHAAGDLGPGESGSVQFSLQLSDTIPSSVEVISNQVEIGHSTSELAFEANSGNNRFTDLDILHGSDLIVTGLDLSATAPDTGETVVFSVTVRNQGTDPPLNSLMENRFPIELYLKRSDFVPSGPPGAVYSPSVFDHFGGWCADYPDCNETRDEYLEYVTDLGSDDAEATLQFQVALPLTGEYNVYVQVDTSFISGTEPWGHDYGLIQEVFETNNIYAHDAVLQVSDSTAYIYLPIILKDSWDLAGP